MVLAKQPSKDPFEMAYEEEEEQDIHEQDSPIESPTTNEDIITSTQSTVDEDNNQNNNLNNNNNINDKQNINDNNPSTSGVTPLRHISNTNTGKNKDDDEEEEEENMDMELGKFPSSGDPDKMAKMQLSFRNSFNFLVDAHFYVCTLLILILFFRAILSQFTEEQMSRYESFRRSGFQKANMKKLLASITGSPKISVPMTIVVSGIAKMFVGELVETARMVMNERKETGPIRPCHIREAYRRLKLEGKIPKKSVPRLFR
ncbi:hypothetical protein AQUCO_03300038v1 [Aquilegia coerulea]|uniref:TAFII28-like protein domain-containing protein n=1 Tax=Aquilegia coerulea TaxID=218851 RepID=A0A2G5CZ76_AQUCA|nr:hypothetical protein AQUCO_03300038v1 [Aquilegia coerulea]